MPFPPYTSNDDLGSIPDSTVRRYLEPLSLLEQGDCILRSIEGERLAMHCRVFLAPTGERLIAIYDRLSDTLRSLVAVDGEGDQHVLWRPADAPAPAVVEGVSL
jgi:hypothetical protein